MSLTQKELIEELEYNPDNGEFIRLKRRGTVHAGTLAGVNPKTNGYIEIRVCSQSTDGKSKKYKAHRLAWLYMTGEFPKLEIDHIDGNRANNKWDNLREVNRSINQRNRKIHSNSPSGVLGVTWNRKNFKWQVNFNKKYFGSFDDFHEAVKVRKKLEEIDGTFECSHSSSDDVEFV